MLLVKPPILAAHCILTLLSYLLVSLCHFLPALHIPKYQNPTPPAQAQSAMAESPPGFLILPDCTVEINIHLGPFA